MATVDAKETYRNLKKKGFVDSPGDHKRLELFYDNNLILQTKMVLPPF